MDIRRLTSWHKFTYSQLYPAVLGSLLYDVLHIRADWGAVQFLELAITVAYCLDYFHLEADLGSSDPQRGSWHDTAGDALIAILFGLAYWRASDKDIVWSFRLLFVVGVLFLWYNWN